MTVKIHHKARPKLSYFWTELSRSPETENASIKIVIINKK